MTMTKHSEYEDLLGPYALDALDATETALLEEHLKTCVRCSQEVASLQEALAEIAPEDPDYDSNDLWDRIAATIEVSEANEAAKIIPITAKRRWHAPRLSTAVASIAILAAFVATGSSLYASNARSSVLSSVPKLQAQIIANLQKAPGHRDITLSSTNGKYRISLLVAPSGLGYITSSNLPNATSAKTYQLWGLKKSTMVSLGILGADGTSAQFVIPANSSFTELAISLEPSGGSVAPTSAPVVSGVY